MNETALKSKMLEGLNGQQEKAVSFARGPLLIVAGAGTGKTTVLTRRIAWLLESGLAKPEEILALTFTEKAAGEMAERVDLLMQLGYAEIEISTFHAFCQKILAQHALDIGLPGDFKILTETRAWMLMRNHLHDFDLNYYKPLGNPGKFIHALLKHFGKAKGEGITPEEYLKFAETLLLAEDSAELKGKIPKPRSGEPTSGRAEEGEEALRVAEVANAYHRYQKLLLDRSLLDFGDLINYTLRLFKTRPKILAQYQNRFKYLLIDEFQDTDFSQYELVKMIAGDSRNITVVGDDDQSIYKFRGASISNILKFKEDFKGAAEVALTDNYRSAQNILDLAYAFIQQNNPERLESRLNISKQLVSHLPENGTIEVLHTKTVYEEAKTVAEKICTMHEQGSSLNDFAILVRANDHADPFISELNRRGITYMFVANRGLYKKPFILDILSYLKLLDNRHESENLFRVLNMPRFKIADSDLIKLSQTAKRRTISLYETISEPQHTTGLSKESQTKIQDLCRLIESHTQAAREKNVTEVIVQIIKETGIIRQLAEDSIKNSENRSILSQFYRKAQAFENESDDKSVRAFLENIRLELESGDTGDLIFDPELGPEAVKIMTIHSSKGLEFDCVFVVNMVEQRFPSRERREQIEIPKALVKEILSEGDVHLMEERRLFYVAATRAKRFLYFTWADDYGGATTKKPSRFLVECNLERPVSKSQPAGEVYFQEQKTLPIRRLDPSIALPDSFSFSQLSTFLKCPLEYKYKYVFHLPFPGSAPLSFGTTIHETLKKYLLAAAQENNAQPDLFGTKSTKFVIPEKKLLFRFYEESWVDDWYPDKHNKEKYRKEGLKILENFYERYEASPVLPKYLEQSFKLKVGNYKFTGKIDRVDKAPDGTVKIIDYKTGVPREKLEAVDKKQLLIYQWAAQEYLNEKVGGLEYWYLQAPNKSLGFLGKPDEILDLREEIQATIEEITETIKTNSFYEKDQQARGHECEFRDLENHVN